MPSSTRAGIKLIGFFVFTAADFTQPFQGWQATPYSFLTMIADELFIVL